MEELFFHMATQAQGAELALYSIKLVSHDTLVSARKLLWSSFFSTLYCALGLGGVDPYDAVWQSREAPIWSVTKTRWE